MNHCPMDNCRFRYGDRPCLFYFEYKDGTTTCANASERAIFDRQRELDQLVNEVDGKEKQ